MDVELDDRVALEDDEEAVAVDDEIAGGTAGATRCKLDVADQRARLALERADAGTSSRPRRDALS